MNPQSTNEDELKQALSKDFHSLLVKEFTTDWQTQRMVRDLELSVMSLDNLQALIATHTAQTKAALTDKLLAGARTYNHDDGISMDAEPIQAIPVSHVKAVMGGEV